MGRGRQRLQRERHKERDRWSVTDRERQVFEEREMK